MDCELAGGLDALMLDAFGASDLDDAARPEKEMLLDDGQVDAIDLGVSGEAFLGVPRGSRSHCLAVNPCCWGRSLSEVLEAMWVWTPQDHRSTCWRRCWPTQGHSNDLVRDLLPLPRAAVEAHLSRALLATVGSRLTHGGSLDGDPFSSNEFLVLCTLDRAPCVTGPQRPSHSRSVGGA